MKRLGAGLYLVVAMLLIVFATVEAVEGHYAHACFDLLLFLLATRSPA